MILQSVHNTCSIVFQVNIMNRIFYDEIAKYTKPTWPAKDPHFDDQ